MLDTAMKAAKEAGAILERYFETSLEKRLKDDNSIVTEADEKAEEKIIENITRMYPDHGILGEESGKQTGAGEYTWIIDPLDGTQNFVNGIPLFAVSIGVVRENMPVVGVVYNPITDTLFYAEQGKGAYWNGHKIRVSAQELNTAMITIGTSSKPEDKDLVRKCFAAANGYVKSVRYLGSAVLELAYLARGGTEGFLNIGTKPWDYAAGSLLVLEAGGTITGFTGGAWNFTNNYFIASNGVIHSSLLQLMETVQHEK
jgi:myo-inositol-1(or 4)-monophosphatase